MQYFVGLFILGTIWPAHIFTYASQIQCTNTFGGGIKCQSSYSSYSSSSGSFGSTFPEFSPISRTSSTTFRKSSHGFPSTSHTSSVFNNFGSMDSPETDFHEVFPSISSSRLFTENTGSPSTNFLNLFKKHSSFDDSAFPRSFDNIPKPNLPFSNSFGNIAKINFPNSFSLNNEQESPITRTINGNVETISYKSPKETFHISTSPGKSFSTYEYHEKSPSLTTSTFNNGPTNFFTTSSNDDTRMVFPSTVFKNTTENRETIRVPYNSPFDKPVTTDFHRSTVGAKKISLEPTFSTPNVPSVPYKRYDNTQNITDTCVLPPTPMHGTYEIGGKGTNYRTGDRISNIAVLTYSCEKGYSLFGNKHVYCKNGQWTSNNQCLMDCEPLVSTTVNFKCQTSPTDSFEPCHKTLASGTIVSSSCKPGYKPMLPLVQLKCTDGQWDNIIPRCVNANRTIGSPPIPRAEAPCIMPENPPNGRYIAGASDTIQPGDTLPGYAVLLTECNEGYAPHSTNGELAYCSNGKWTPLLKCLKLCPTVKNDKMVFNCQSPPKYAYAFYKLETVSCDQPLPHNSIMNTDCAPSYYTETLLKSTKCVNGTWDKPLPKCKPRLLGSSLPILTNGSCILPNQDPNGVYTYRFKPRLTTGDIVPDLSVITFSCRSGYRSTANYSLCDRGQWNTPLKCLKMCEPLKSITVDFTCKLNGQKVDCESPLENGTIVDSECKESYREEQLVLPTLTCLNGNWNKEPPKCMPQCGTITPVAEKKVINGTNAKLGEFPWHVALYDTLRLVPEQICGGSIINARLVVTAAHCIWKEGHGKRNPSNYVVASGKYYRIWQSPNENEKNIQRSNVSEILVPDNYWGDSNRQQADIALLVLMQPIIFNPFVRPICMSWDPAFDRYHLSEDNVGKVAGWGLTSKHTKSYSPVLKTATLPFVSIMKCRSSSPAGFKELLTVDKFCGGYIDRETGVCVGDSGGGFVFLSTDHFTERYYLRGIVSMGPADLDDSHACRLRSYTAFTHVITHAEWLKKQIDKYILY